MLLKGAPKMLQKYAAVHFQFATLVLLIMLALIVSLTTSTATEVNASPDAQVEVAFATFQCTPARVAAFTNRVHIRCSTAAPGAISYFAVSSSDSGTASCFLSIFTTAKVTGKDVLIYYVASDTSGSAWGCNASDCRVALGAELLP